MQQKKTGPRGSSEPVSKIACLRGEGGPVRIGTPGGWGADENQEAVRIGPARQLMNSRPGSGRRSGATTAEM